MVVSGLFSIAIYKGADLELQRLERRQQIRFERFRGAFLFRSDFPDMFAPEPVEEIRQRLIVTLMAINAGIFVVSGCAGYILAGQTLKPIGDMVDEQNRFITDASHELRTPITALKTEIEVGLRDKNLTFTDARKLLASNLEETNTLQAISDKLLNLAQIQKPSSFVFETISLKTIIEEAYTKVLPLARAKQITIQKTVGNSRFTVDKARITQVLVILLDNAIKYSHEHSTIRIDAKKSDHTIRISVADDGVGIESRDLPYIFDRFFRAEKSRSKDRIPGYGLGLSIAKKIVDAHSGIIHVRSTIGKGTTVFVRLPTDQNKTRT